MVPRDETWTSVRRFMHDRCGVVLDPAPASTVETRLQALAREYGFRSVDEYVAVACAAFAPQCLVQALINTLTSNETWFFRDPSFFDALACCIVPRVRYQLDPAEPLRIWCAACSTGQEAYSVAMLLADRHLALFERAEIIATDVAENVLEQAWTGTYSTAEVQQGLKPKDLQRHFERTHGGYRVGEHLRRRVRFRCGNLLDRCDRTPGYHLILCRNVLGSFALRNRKRVVQRLYSVLRPGGCIGVGNIEEIQGRRLVPGWYAVQSADA